MMQTRISFDALTVGQEYQWTPSPRLVSKGVTAHKGTVTLINTEDENPNKHFIMVLMGGGRKNRRLRSTVSDYEISRVVPPPADDTQGLLNRIKALEDRLASQEMAQGWSTALEQRVLSLESRLTPVADDVKAQVERLAKLVGGASA